MGTAVAEVTAFLHTDDTNVVWQPLKKDLLKTLTLAPPLNKKISIICFKSVVKQVPLRLHALMRAHTCHLE